MNIIRTLRLAALMAGLAVAATSCINPPDYPDTPSIEFKDLTAIRVDNRRGVKDSVIIAVSFKDGNGDMGLSAEDTQPPYQEFLDPATRTPNPDYFNYFCQPQKKVGNEFVDIPTRPEYNGRYPRLEPNPDKEAPLRGDLRFTIIFFFGIEFQPGDEVRFRVFLKDRALNQSNTITTSSFVVQP